MDNSKSLTLRPGLSLAQRMLATGAEPDLIIQALDEGLFDGVDLNATAETLPLSEAWARKAKLFELDNYESHLGVLPSLSWPVETDPSQIPLVDKTGKGWLNKAARALWEEHAGIRLVEAGMDPLQRWANNGGKWQVRYENLLDWAAKTGRPWLLQACLKSLEPDVRKWEAGDTLHMPGPDDEPILGTRLHEAMGHALPLVAEVWRENGADIHARNSAGETPIFLSRSCHALEWAMRHRASLADTSNDGGSPRDRWRERAINVEEWAAMQQVAQLSKGDVLALLGGTISRADFEGLKGSFTSLEDTAVAGFPGGHTLIGHAAREFIRANRLSPSRDRWRKSMNKILHFLWTRVDLEGAHANRSNPFLSDRDLAWTASMLVGGLAARAAENARKKHGFSPPALEEVLRWAQHEFSNEYSSSNSHPWARLREWVVFAATKRSTEGATSEMETAHTIRVLNDTWEAGSTSVSEGAKTAILAGPSIVRQRDGEIHMTQETKDRFLVEFIRASCRAISGEHYVSGDSSQSVSTGRFRKVVQTMRMDSAFQDDRDLSLASCITAFLDMGAAFPQGEFEGLDEEMEEARMRDHPVFKEVEPLFALCREREMEKGMPAADAPTLTRNQFRL